MNRYFLMGLAMLIAACASHQKKHIPLIHVSHIYSDNMAEKEAATKESVDIENRARNLIFAIIQKDRESILKQIHPDQGAGIDAKSKDSLTDVRKELYNEDGILYPVFWDTEKLKKLYPNSDLKSYQDYFSEAEEIMLDLFFYNSSECEVKIKFLNRPPAGVMGNLIYFKNNGQWFLMRLF